LTTSTVILKSQRDKSVRNRHPRLFAGAIKQIDGKPKDGDAIDVVDNKGEWLARGVINQQSQIAVRLLTWDASETIDETFWRKRVHESISRREIDPLLRHTDARRLIFGESDGLPGVIADDYAGNIVLELSTRAALDIQHIVVDALSEMLRPSRVVRQLDTERLRFEFGGRAPKKMFEATPTENATIEIRENDLRFLVQLGGQKTGFYLDQRDNRARVAAYCNGATVLNVFSYTGAFAVYAARAGATQVINVDSSSDALQLAERNSTINRQSSFVNRCADAFDFLRARRKAGELFDAVILDPPKFAHNSSQIEKAARAYKDLNRIGLSLVKRGGVLATFSCSGVIDAALFQKIIFSAALEAKRETQVVERLSQASDHPVLLSFPESDYLKGLIVRVV
jgi:23S rRNA (cytosine1962-C5)-methyltransferase